jgi:DNA polymerase elongation subunit (family B)
MLENKKPIILLFCRDGKTGKRKIVRVRNFKPYLYIQPTHFFMIPKTFRIKKETTRFRDIFQRPVMKVEVDVPSSVKKIRTFFTKNKAPTWEADFLFPLRYMVDKGIFEGVQEAWDGVRNANVPSVIRSFYYDIEALSVRGTKVNPRADEPIICITGYDDFTKEYVTLYVGNKPLESSMEDAKMVRCNSERELLLQFIRYVRKYDPDLFVGFYNQRYDDVKIFSRMKALKINPRLLSPVKQVQDRGDEEGIAWKGMECFDLYWAYRILKPKELLEYNLDYVSMIELGEKKVPIFDFSEDWKTNPNEVIRRNQRDVELMVKLNDKLQLIKYFDENRRLVGCRFQDVFKRSRVGDILLMRWCHLNEIALPSKWEQELVEQEGAIVFDPIPGIYKDVLYLDFKAMYPSIVIAFNICPTTYSPYEGIPVNPERKYFYLPKEDKRGIVPSLLSDILELRWKIQEQMDQAKEDGDDEAFERYFFQQQSVKFQANAIYGLLKYRAFRMFSQKAAESIAWMGRRFLEKAREIVEKDLGLAVIYGDTDGIMVLSDPEKDLKEQSEEVVGFINIKINEWLLEEFGLRDADIEIKVEDLLQKLMIPTRKKYAFLDGEGKRKEKGLPTVRTDVSNYSREIVSDVIDMIFEEKSKTEVLKYVRSKVVRLRKGEVNPWDIAVPKRITKDFDEYKTKAIHVTAAEYSNKHLDGAFIRGTKPRYIYISRVPDGLPYHKAIALEEYRTPPEGFEYNWEQMIEKEVRGKVEDILNLYGISWEQVHYHSLDRWFN